MPVYISLLRGINLGGHKLVAMDKLRASVEDIGCAAVRTYIQSGNLVFRARKSSTGGKSEPCCCANLAFRCW
jgi:uncharacterized protein (DUF1697 family)